MRVLWTLHVKSVNRKIDNVSVLLLSLKKITVVVILHVIGSTNNLLEVNAVDSSGVIKHLLDLRH